jgi:hypothetical protein
MVPVDAGAKDWKTPRNRGVFFLVLVYIINKIWWSNIDKLHPRIMRGYFYYFKASYLYN